ncbi:MAG: diaminopimelate decarboxylase, partial [Propionibacteriaceae bacterium]|nr:diaminopimelate decarboxylase [Propionibacteriaceae bacterium]
RQRAEAFRTAFAGWSISYAGKAFLCGGMARWAEQEGLGLDVCSGHELAVALAAGFPAERITFHGNNKSTDDLRAAVEAGARWIVVDSDCEIARLEALGQELGRPIPVLVRVTTGIDAHTDERIATALWDQKFGFSTLGGPECPAAKALKRCHESPVIDLAGVHSHVGSQIFDTPALLMAGRRLLGLLDRFHQETGAQPRELNLGGGFGIAYTVQDHPGDLETVAQAFRTLLDEAAGRGLTELHGSIEPGRSLIGPAGTALYTVGTVKPVDTGGGRIRWYVAVDGGMSDNIRPALYGADYTAVVANRVSGAAPVLARVVGRHCESGDILVRDVYLPGDIAPGDLIAMPGCGAYSRAMASNYNLFARPPVIALGSEGETVMVRRERWEDIVALDPVISG